jgi:DNA-damage-inducible protein D
MTKEIEQAHQNTFESIKHRDDQGEFWYARELGEALGYTNWKSFSAVVERAKVSMKRSGTVVDNHFEHVLKMVSIGYGNERKIDDVRLTRFACYIIAQNGNPTIKPKIAEAQNYFATQTRKRELDEQYQTDINRLARRQEFSESDKRLSSNVLEVGVSPRGLGRIKSEGDKEYFGGKTASQVKRTYGVAKGRPWADKASNVVLAGKTLANELTAADIESGVSNFPDILKTNNDNNKQVRRTIIKQRGTAPEEYAPEEDTERIKKRVERRSRGLLE